MQTSIPFLYRYVTIDGYEQILEEVRAEILSRDWTNSFGFYHIESGRLLDACPLLKTWFGEHDMVLRATGVIIVNPHVSNNIHIDSMSKKWSKLALNMNIQNCENSTTKLFQTSRVPEPAAAQSGAGYFKYPADTEFTEVGSFVLSRPVLFNTQVPHQVCNSSPTRRMSISFRFYKDPDFLMGS